MSRAASFGLSKPVCRLAAGHANVLGVGVSAVNLNDAVRLIDAAIYDGTKGYICLTGVHGVMEAQRDVGFRTILNSALLTLPDGMPMTWVGRLQRCSGISRVFGPDLMLRICDLSRRRGYRNFLYGGAPGVAEELRHVLRLRFPGLNVVGFYTPPFRALDDRQEAELAAILARLKPDVVWVGLSTPKQERFMAEYLPKLDTKLMVGVGAAFDFHTGRIKDAPQWLKQAGLQWLHRMLQDPMRLSKRYLSNNPAFLGLICLQLLGILRYDVLSPHYSSPKGDPYPDASQSQVRS